MSFKTESLDWSTLKLFMEVADAHTLALAASRTGVSAPTLHRRMADLESALKMELFERGAGGYRLTANGRELRDLMDDAAIAMVKIDEWRAGQTALPPLRVACGPWTSMFIGEMGAALAEGLKGRPLRLLIGTTQADLTRRQADIGIRNLAPSQMGLAGQRVAHVAYAVYGAPDLAARAEAVGLDQAYADLPWIALDVERPTASSRFLSASLAGPPVATSDHPMPLLNLARSGAGLCLLPCFIGDRTSGLRRVGDALPALRQEQWFVTADTRRHDPPIRAGLGVLKRLWRAHRGVFAGLT